SEGPQAMVDWFRVADAAAPNADLYLNEYGILASGGGVQTANQDQLVQTLQYLEQNGAPIDGVGLQSHFTTSSLTGPEQLWEVLDRFAELGLNIQVTEFDFGVDDEQLQAQYTRDFYTAVFAHEGVSDLLTWGFWEGAHWRPNAAMFRTDWSIKPNGEAFLDLVFGEWWTDEATTVDDSGRAVVRGFLGDYVVDVSSDRYDVATQIDMSLDASGAALEAALDVLIGDFDRNRQVDAADFLHWQRETPATRGASLLDWQTNFGASLAGASLAVPTNLVPEPAGASPWAICALALLPRYARRRLRYDAPSSQRWK
ncbi:MAG: endo-1,4-beta-xylanase, partial [Planctomycetales bacterium]|nr:endo-1,4-beta-xylanase [Planctomycetales bacterium]